MANEFKIKNGLISDGDIVVTGSISATGGINIPGSIESAETASFAPSYTLTSSFNSYTSSASSSLGSLSSSVATTTSGLASRIGSVETKTGSYTTTGSNIFIGDQTITGSICSNGNIVTTGQIVAQTINVQQVTSSIVYSCGSNIFGNTLSNTQQFTGSMLMTGSLTVNGCSIFSGNITANNGFEISANNNALACNNTLRFTDTDTATELNQQIGKIEFYSNDISTPGAGVKAYIGTFASDSTPDAYIAFATQDGSGTPNPVERLRISSEGNVGIGTNTPSNTYGRLTVAGTGISIEDDGNAKLQIGRYSSTACNAYVKMGNNACSLRFTNNTDLTDLVVIEKGGNVGVGTTTPSQKLEVSGNTKVNGTVVMNSPFIFRNKIHNGDMRIDQRYNGATISNTEGTRPVDRYIIYNQIASNWSTQRSTVAPPGFANSLLATSTTGGSIGAGSYGGIRHQIEGLNTLDLAWGTASAKNITVSFWVRSSVTGTYGFTIRNGNTNNYGYVSAYTISSANTWTYITLNIPGPTSGTWATDNLPSLNCIWDLGAGTSYSQAAGSWISASEILGLTGGVKFFTNSSATYYLTGVQLEIGDVATPFEFLPYDVQLRQAQRYFQKWGNGVMFQAGQLGQVGGAYDFFKMIGGGVFGGGEMRDTPTISYDSAGTYWVGVGTAGTGTIGDAGTIPSSQYSSPQSLHILKTGIGRLGIGDFNTFSPTPVRGRWYVPNSDFVWVSAEI